MLIWKKKIVKPKNKPIKAGFFNWLKNIWIKFILFWFANSNAQTLNPTIIKSTEIIVSIGTIPNQYV